MGERARALRVLVPVAVAGAAVAFLTQALPTRHGTEATPHGRSGTRPARAAPERARVIAQRGAAVEVDGEAANGIAADDHTLLWETLAGEEGGTALLVARNTQSGRVTTLERGVAPLYGMAANGTSVVYATGASPVRLVLLDRSGGHARLLSRGLTTPIAWRGSRVAWAERRAGRERVVVYDFSRQRRWIAADMATCEDRRCYRIDSVTLADAGVVFARGAVGPQPSFVVRRAFSARRPSWVRIVGDPQPDLAPSASGAVYYVLDKGWYVWDFGQRTPHSIAGLRGYPLLTDDGHWLLVATRGCTDRVVDGSGATVAGGSSGVVRRLTGGGSRVCTRLQGLTWSAGRSVTTWVSVPRAGDSGDITGVLVVGRAGGAATGAAGRR